MLFLAGRRAGLGVGFSVKGMGGQLARASLSGGGNGSEMPNVLPKTPVSLFLAGKEGNVQKTTGEYFGTGKIVAFGVPGAFTPVCSNKHVPSFVKNMDQFKEMGVDRVACISVNDPFVMKAWADSLGVDVDKLDMLADFSGDFAKQIKCSVDLSVAGLGTRTKRFSMYVVNGTVKIFNSEAPGDFESTSAEHLIEQIKEL